jgi:hypothetical protein
LIFEGGLLLVGLIDEFVFMSDWENQLQSEANAIHLPPGAAIIHQPFHNVQIGLTLTRTTPQNSRFAMVLFSEYLSKIPTPPRVRIKFVDILATGVPLKNIAQGAFNQYFGKRDYIISEQIDGLDIRFNQPNDCWLTAESE